jgi:inorganic pyrophosphatase
MASALALVQPKDEATGLLHVVVDTPRGSRNKYKIDEASGCYKLSRVLPAGHYFPFDFGSIPGTRAEDGDALDVLILGEEPTFPGCLLTVRLLGVLVARQTEKGKTIRNDRLVAVPETPSYKSELKDLDDVGASQLRQIEHFLASYNRAQGREFRLVRHSGPAAAAKLVDAAIRARQPKE